MQTEPRKCAFSYPVNVRRLARKGRHIEYEGDEDVRALIARDHDLLEVKTFCARSHVSPWKRDGVKLIGSVHADIVQPCAVTGESLDQRVEESFELTYLPEGSKPVMPQTDSDGELILDPIGDDPPEHFTGDSVDLALSWLEHFTLGIDPFARVEGAEFDPEAEHNLRDSPFSVLEKLKSDPKKT
ncbi:MAG: hypothetical protein ACR2O8_04930 [Rhizobiaceae bacterium]